MFEKVCCNCETPYQAKENARKFCGSSCAATYNNKAGLIGRKNPKKRCAGCKKG